MLLVRYGHVDVKTVDGLHPRCPAHLFLHPAVALAGRDRLRGSVAERVRSRRHKPYLASLDEGSHPPAEVGKLRRQLRHRAPDRGAHLQARSRELGGDRACWEPCGIASGEHVLDGRDKLERGGGDELELFLDADGIGCCAAEVEVHALTLAVTPGKLVKERRAGRDLLP